MDAPAVKRLKDNTAIKVQERGGQKKELGKVFGETFISYLRSESKHLYRGGEDTAAEAKASGRAAWGLDLDIMRDLYETYGVRYVEIPTARTRYRVLLETVLTKGFQKEFGGHRQQIFLPLSAWTEVQGGINPSNKTR